MGNSRAKISAAQLELRRSKARQSGADWRKRNPEKVAACGKRWRDANPEKVRAARRRWNAAHPEAVLALNRGYKKRHRLASQCDSLPAGETLRQRLTKDTLYAKALAAVPAHLPEHVREDAVSALVVALLEGDADATMGAKRFVAEAWGMFDRRALVSVDCLMAPSQGKAVRFVDMLDSDIEHF